MSDKTKENKRANGALSKRQRSVLSLAVLAVISNSVWAQALSTVQQADGTVASTSHADQKPVSKEGSNAQPSSAQKANSSENVTQGATVVVTGTRTGTKASQSLTPVDVISNAQLQATGQKNLRDALVSLSPSISRETYSGDTGMLTDALSLHGLSPDQLLVLVNGKRRHSTANMSIDGGVNLGSTGVDLNMIPIALVDHVEILRDGAAAQYGSDAISGVVNIILKRSSHGGELQTTTGQTYSGDGLNNNESLNFGFNLGDKGFFDLAAEYARQNHTVRTAPDDYFGQFPIGQGYKNLTEGQPASTRESVGFNTGYYLGDDTELYGFGTYAHRDAQSYQNDRPSSILAAVYPNGFTPSETINENDYSITGGVKGKNRLGWAWDLSSTYGGDHEQLGLTNSVNTGLYAAEGYTPTSFHLGAISNTQWTNNLDLSRAVAVPLLPASLNVSFGLEQRRETYSIESGDEASYLYGGSAAMPGLSPVSATDRSRNVLGTYIDLSTHLLPKWTVDVAGRFEHYNDVGSTANGKLSTRYDFTPKIAVRGSVSTGFRAPSLAEEYYSNVSSSPSAISGLLSANSAAAKLIGAQPLKAEKSTNYNIGLVLTPVKDLNVSIDAYQIDIRNRIVLGGTATGDTAVAAMAAAGISIPSGLDSSLVSASYFTNGASTRTRGIDLTSTYRTSFGLYGLVDWDLGIDLNTTSVTHVANGSNGLPELNAQQIAWLTTATPKNKIIIGGTWHRDKWAVSLHETRLGPTTDQETYIVGPNAYSTTQFITFKNAARYVTDVEVRYDLTKKFQIAVGAKNLFNAYPNKLPYEATQQGAQYDAYASTIGEDGGFYYLRARYLF